jgi:hypothetical protein
MRATLRWCGRGLLGLVVVAVGLWLFAQSKQWVLRFRAERLLADVQRLQVKDGTWDDFRRFQTKWGRWGEYQGVCDPTYCFYSVGLMSQPIQYLWYTNASHPRLEKLVEAVGLRDSDAGATVVVRRGSIAAKAFMMGVQPPLAQANTAYSILSGEGPSVQNYSRDRAMHPDHGLYMTNRENLIVTFTPEENANERAALMDFHFDCITAFRPCADRARLLPAAVSEFESEPVNVQYDRQPPCNMPFWIYARDGQAVIVGDVLSAELVGSGDDMPDARAEWLLTVHIEEVLKGKIARPTERPIQVYVFDDRLPAPKSKEFPFKSVIAAGRIESDPYGAPMMSEPCATVEDKPGNRGQAQLGIAKDFSPEPLQER